jgi:hypothetical protein
MEPIWKVIAIAFENLESSKNLAQIQHRPAPAKAIKVGRARGIVDRESATVVHTIKSGTAYRLISLNKA